MKSLAQHIAESLSEEVQTNTISESNSDDSTKVNESEEDKKNEE